MKDPIHIFIGLFGEQFYLSHRDVVYRYRKIILHSDNKTNYNITYIYKIL